MSLTPIYSGVSQQLSATNLGMFRNRIINGDMRIDQRNSSNVPLTLLAGGASNGFAMDRFICYKGTNIAATFGQVDVPSPLYGFQKCAKLAVTTAQISLAANDSLSFVQRIEGYNIADFGWGTSTAQPVTVSLWLYSSTTGTLTVSLRNYSATRSYPSNVTIASSNTWQYVSFTVPGETSGIWESTTNVGIYLTISISAGTTYQGTDNTWNTGNYFATSSTTNFAASTNTIYVTGIQLEKGTIATPFEFRPYSIELQMCQRYYVCWVSTYANPVSMCFAISATAAIAILTVPVQLRTSLPTLKTSTGSGTITQSGTGDLYANIAGTDRTFTTIQLEDRVVNNCARVLLSGSSGITAGHAGMAYIIGTGKFTALDAEL